MRKAARAEPGHPMPTNSWVLAPCFPSEGLSLLGSCCKHQCWASLLTSPLQFPQFPPIPVPASFTTAAVPAGHWVKALVLHHPSSPRCSALPRAAQGALTPAPFSPRAPSRGASNQNPAASIERGASPPSLPSSSQGNVIPALSPQAINSSPAQPCYPETTATAHLLQPLGLRVRAGGPGGLPAAPAPHEGDGEGLEAAARPPRVATAHLRSVAPGSPFPKSRRGFLPPSLCISE